MINIFLNCFQSCSEDVDSKRIKKLAKELLALERAYALLQAQVSSAVDVERDEMVCLFGSGITFYTFLSMAPHYNRTINVSKSLIFLRTSPFLHDCKTYKLYLALKPFCNTP